MSKLNEIYYNSKTGYMSKDKFIKIAKMMGVSKEMAENFYNSQSVNQIYKERDQKQKYRSIESPRNEPGTLQMDLLIMTKFKAKTNQGYNYILNILDVYSRYVKAYVIKNKEPEHILPHVKEYVIEFRKLYPKNTISVTMDYGNEFRGVLKEYFKKENIEIYIASKSTNTKNRNYLVERFHRTFWEKLRKIMTHEGSQKWLDYYQDIVENYNNQIHSKTQMTPKSIFIDKQLRTMETLITNPIKQNFKAGDRVRIIIEGKIFDKKSFEPKWSIEIYEITKIENNRYFVKNKKGLELKQSFLERELQKTENENSGKVEEFREKGEVVKKIKQKVRRLQREKIHEVDEDGEYIIDEKLKPEREKRIRKPVNRLLF
jgi:ribosomal protein L21E